MLTRSPLRACAMARDGLALSSRIEISMVSVR
jgi:hypothetical protein